MTTTDTTLTYHEFLAVLINQMQSPGGISPLWLCMNEQAKAKQLEQAEIHFERWRENELEQAEKRHQGVYGISTGDLS